jgi:drug/metabolite transporter (DMT)-like permease
MKLAYVAFIIVCAVWGTTYLAVRVALDTVPVLLITGLRWMAAGVIMSGLMIATGRGLPPLRLWGPLALLGLLMNVIGNGFVVYAQQYVASGLTAVIIATTPFWQALLERLLPSGERFSGRALGGLTLGFTGILILVWPEMTNGGATGRTFFFGVIAIQLACIGWVVGTSYAKRHELGDNPFPSTALQMVFSGIMLLTAATAHGDWATVVFTPRSIVAIAYLTIAGSLIAYSAYIYVIQHLPLSLVSIYTYINPIIAVALGTAFLDEPFTARMALAVAFVLVGTWIVGKKP